MKPLLETLKRHSLISGIILMFLFTWPLEFASAGYLHLPIPGFLYIFTGYGIVVAVLLMTALTLGRSGVVALLKRYLIWRVGWKWWLVALFLFPVSMGIGVLLNAWRTQAPLDFSTVSAHKIFGPSPNLLPFLLPFFLVDLISNGEEIGWRGYVLPRLQVRYSALVSSLLIGVLWGFWHLPLFVTPWDPILYGWYVVKMVIEAVLYTWLYNNTKGSLLLMAVLHSAGNTAGLFLPIASRVGGSDLGSLIFQIAVEFLIAVAVVWTAGASRLSQTEPKQVAAEVPLAAS